MVLFCQKDSPGEWRGPQAKPGSNTGRVSWHPYPQKRAPCCSLLVYKLTGPGSEFQAQVCKATPPLFSPICLIRPPVPHPQPGTRVPSHRRPLVTQRSLARVPGRYFSSTFPSAQVAPEVSVAAWDAGILPGPGPSLPCSHLPRTGAGGKAGPLPENHRSQLLFLWGPLLPCWQLLRCHGSSPPTDTWHHCACGLRLS